MNEPTITLSPCRLAGAKKFTRGQYEALKQTGFLWESYPDAPSVWPLPEEPKPDETESLRTDIEQLKRIVLDLEGEVEEGRKEKDELLAKLTAAKARFAAQVDYSVQLQRLVESLCRGTPISDEITANAPYHAVMGRVKQAEEASTKAMTEAYMAAGVSWDGKWVNTRAERAEAKVEALQKDTDYLNAYIKMVQEEFPYTPYFRSDEGDWVYPCEVSGAGGFGGGVGLKSFAFFRDAIDSVLKEPFVS